MVDRKACIGVSCLHRPDALETQRTGPVPNRLRAPDPFYAEQYKLAARG
jgi:hypothetical protein